MSDTPRTDQAALFMRPFIAPQNQGRFSSVMDEMARLERENAELLEAAKEAVKVLERMDTLRHIDPTFPALDKCRAAIAKAKKVAP